MKAIESLEKTTFMVSEIGLFSDNEVVFELPTSSLKFLLLPYLLGTLVLKRLNIPRTETLRLAKIYYLDFLKRCKEYDLTNMNFSKFYDDEETEENAAKPSNNIPVKKSSRPTPQVSSNYEKILIVFFS